jgi:hypothetical protein
MNDRNEQISKVKNLPAPIQNRSDTQPTKRSVRGATRMKKLALDLIDGQKLPIEFDESTGKPLGENKTKFKSYVGFLGRSKVSILTEDWDSVDQSLKDEVWKDILVIVIMFVNVVFNYIIVIWMILTDAWDSSILLCNAESMGCS